jgi:hypothetical protein
MSKGYYQIKRRRKTRRYHLVDDDAAVFDYVLPDWLVGGD